jgi:tetraacyldisaccharide 4'-kinase
MNAVERAWRREGLDGKLLHAMLLPAAQIYGAAARLRTLSYRLRLRRGRRLPVAVVSVGNLSVGGTAKTPTALWLAQRLQRDGYRVAILSRGYGGNAREPMVASATAEGDTPKSLDPAVIGDENVVLARRFTGPVVVGRRRADAGAAAWRNFAVDVVVLDDGFQHLALWRDFDLVCLRPRAGDDAMLPAGRLREPLSALRRAHAVLVTAGAGSAGLGARLERRLAELPVFRGEVRAVGLVTPDRGGWRELPMALLAERRALGVVGLADPRPFYDTLLQWDAQLEDFLEFPDHHVYTLDDWKKIAYVSRGLDLVVTTEKDLVKLERFPFAKDKLVAVRVAMHVEDEDALVRSVTAAVERRKAELAAHTGRSS